MAQFNEKQVLREINKYCTFSQANPEDWANREWRSIAQAVGCKTHVLKEWFFGGEDEE